MLDKLNVIQLREFVLEVTSQKDNKNRKEIETILFISSRFKLSFMNHLSCNFRSNQLLHYSSFFDRQKKKKKNRIRVRLFSART